MSNYIELTILTNAGSIRELLIAQLSAKGYNGFEESDTLLKAYIPEADFSEIGLDNLFNIYSLIYSKSVIKKQNWNELWESNFEPVRVADFVGIRASFHPPFENVAHEIIITPKMSFGTGHHATTYMVMQMMRDLDCTDKSVFDFGTGTGILAILAEKLGATKILAVDNDDWCIENALENIAINGCRAIDIQKTAEPEFDQKFDIILANINKHIILTNIQALCKGLNPGGQLLLSGLLVEDEQDILEAGLAQGLQHKQTIERNGWIAAWFYTNS